LLTNAFASRDYADQLVKIVALIGKPSPEIIARIPDEGAREFVEGFAKYFVCYVESDTKNKGLRDYRRVEWSTLMPKVSFYIFCLFCFVFNGVIAG
jgi:hypothetical protein